jgi:hypothetical protein
MIKTQNKRGVSPGIFILKENDAYLSNLWVYRNPFLPQRIPFSDEIKMLLYGQLSKYSTHKKLSQDASDIKTVSKYVKLSLCLN